MSCDRIGSRQLLQVEKAISEPEGWRKIGTKKSLQVDLLNGEPEDGEIPEEGKFPIIPALLIGTGVAIVALSVSGKQKAI